MILIVANSPDLSALAFSIATSTPVITTANVNSSYSLTTVTATSDVLATMLQKSIGTGSPCDAARNVDWYNCIYFRRLLLAIPMMHIMVLESVFLQ